MSKPRVGRLVRIILFSFVFSFAATAQQGYTDSLLQVIQNALDREKEQAYLQLVNHYRNNNPQQALVYLDGLIDLGTTLKDESVLGKACQEAGLMHFRLGNFSKAKEYYQQALASYAAQGNSRAQNDVNAALAGIAFAQGNLPLAAEIYLKTLRYYEEINDKAGMVASLNALGNIYARQNNFSRAIEYNLRAIGIYEASADKFRTLVSYDNIGNIYLKQGSYARAAEFFNKSLRIYRELGNRAGEAATLQQLGNIAQKEGNDEKAVSFYKRSLQISVALNAQPMQVASMMGMARSYFNMKLYDQCVATYQKGIAVARKMDMKLELDEAYRGLEEAYEATRELEKATTFNVLRRELEHSLYNDSNIKKLADLELVYQTEKKQRQIELLSKEQQLKDTEISNAKRVRNIFAYAAIILGIVFVGMIFFALQNKRIASDLRRQTNVLLAQKEQLNQLNRVKDRFFSIISHDLRNNLTTMKLYFDLVSNPAYVSTDHSEVTHQISGSVENTIDLLENLLVWASAQIKGIEIHIQKVNLHSLAQENINLLNGTAHQKKIDMVNEVDEGITAYADIDMINLVLRNLISNAIKFTPQKGRIEISAEKKGGFVYVHVKDNGIGISAENIRNLFDQHLHPTTKGTGNEKGTGLGLMLCRDFVERNGGEIRVQSEKGAGSIFSFSLRANS